MDQDKRTGTQVGGSTGTQEEAFRLLSDIAPPDSPLWPELVPVLKAIRSKGPAVFEAPTTCIINYRTSDGALHVGQNVLAGMKAR